MIPGPQGRVAPKGEGRHRIEWRSCPIWIDEAVAIGEELPVSRVVLDLEGARQEFRLHGEARRVVRSADFHDSGDRQVPPDGSGQGAIRFRDMATEREALVQGLFDDR